MTTRRLNYTGCQRIRRTDVAIVVDRTSTPPSFTCSHDLIDYEFPGDARIVIEAQSHWTLMRFDCGSVGAWPSDQPFALSDFASPAGIGFRLKVLGSGAAAGLILGEADGIRPADPDGREEARSLLSVQPADLGNVVWRLSFAGAAPLLQINSKIPDWRSFVRRADIRALLMPELYRQMLREALWNAPDADALDTWQIAVLAMVPPSAGPPPPEGDDDARDAWIDDAVRLFAAKHRLMRGVTEWGTRDA